jgi:transcriptional regulator with XRE-family HTH domain
MRTNARGIRQARRQRGLTQTQAAALAGLHQSQLSMIERGRLIPSVSQAERLGRVLGIPADRLLGDTRGAVRP